MASVKKKRIRERRGMAAEIARQEERRNEFGSRYDAVPYFIPDGVGALGVRVPSSNVPVDKEGLPWEPKSSYEAPPPRLARSSWGYRTHAVAAVLAGMILSTNVGGALDAYRNRLQHARTSATIEQVPGVKHIIADSHDAFPSIEEYFEDIPGGTFTFLRYSSAPISAHEAGEAQESPAPSSVPRDRVTRDILGLF